ncbi:MAG: zinc ribbon domain-containing protein [Pirellulales bacterium]
MNQPTRNDISDSRKVLYYGGMALSVVGLLTFLSLFVMFPNPLAGPDGFGNSMQSFAGRGIAGMVMMIAGRALQTAGKRGLAGAGLVLDPQQARKDVEPWSRMAGGIVEDALSEVDLAKHTGQGAHSESAVVKVRCRNCQALNDEAARFCDQCGKEV